MMNFSGLILLAYQAAEQAAQEAPKAQPEGLPGLFSSIAFPIMLTVLIVLLFNPFGKREDKKQKQFIESLKKNDRVLLAGGIYARVVNVKEGEDEVVVKVDEDRDVKLVVTKGSILRLADKTEESNGKAAS